MKKCNYCNNPLNDEDTHCFHCGMPYVDKLNKQKSTNLAYVFCLIMVMFIVTYLYYSFLINQSGGIVSTSKNIVVGEYRGTLESYDIANYIFYDKNEFINSVEGASDYINGMLLFEKNLYDNIPDGSSVDENFTTAITLSNNIYFSNEYKITLNDNSEIIISINYDLYDQVNKLDIMYGLGYKEDYDQLLLSLDNLVSITYLLEGLGYEQFDQSSIIGNFDLLEEKFHERSNLLGNYGITSKTSFDDITTNIIVTSSKDMFYIKLKLNTILLDKYLK